MRKAGLILALAYFFRVIPVGAIQNMDLKKSRYEEGCFD